MTPEREAEIRKLVENYPPETSGVDDRMDLLTALDAERIAHAETRKQLDLTEQELAAEQAECVKQFSRAEDLSDRVKLLREVLQRHSMSIEFMHALAEDDQRAGEKS